jgi:hypothetical protein
MGRSYRARVTDAAASRVRGVIELVDLSRGHGFRHDPGDRECRRGFHADLQGDTP